MENNLKMFIEKANLIHENKYLYLLCKYKNSKIKIDIICPEHGEFEQTPNAHLSGKGCPKCGLKNRKNNKTKTNESFIIEANKIHNDKYDY